MKDQSKNAPGLSPAAQETGSASWLPVAAWGVAAALVLLALILAWRAFALPGAAAAGVNRQALANSQSGPSNPAQDSLSLATLSPADAQTAGAPAADGILRRSDLRTIIPERPNEAVIEYTVVTGDSVFEIANQFGLKPESVLWANYDQLNDNPDMIALEMQLAIPPVDGVLYTWKDGDTPESVAAQFQADPQAILNWPGNQIDLTTQVVEPGAQVMVPGGKREFRQWIIPTIPRGRAGVSQSLYGGGACEGSFTGAFGTGTFVWPAGNHVLSGNDYWDGHLAIDIAAGEGAPVYAADSGVVVFAGPATGGYGNMVMIDHGNGYQTLYAHLSSVRVNCGQSISQGGTIGFGGSTGNSTGPHLHFEVRYQGGFVSPWYVLPAP